MNLFDGVSYLKYFFDKNNTYKTVLYVYIFMYTNVIQYIIYTLKNI